MEQTIIILQRNDGKIEKNKHFFEKYVEIFERIVYNRITIDCNNLQDWMFLRYVLDRRERLKLGILQKKVSERQKNTDKCRIK